MKKIKKFLKEGTEGLFLLLIAVVILNIIPGGVKDVESKNEKTSVREEQVSNEEQILEEASEKSEEMVEEIPKETVGNSSKETVIAQNTQEEAVSETASVAPDAKDIIYDELKANLKKYCDKKFDTKKCRRYLLEAKDAREKGKRFVELYKKYHFEPKEEEKRDNLDVNSGDVKEEATLVINYAGSKSDDKYAVIIGSGMTVMDMMREAKKNNGLSYAESADWPGYIQEINNTREDIPNNIFWMFEYNGKMASEGASTLKVKSGDKVEWKYMEVSW